MILRSRRGIGADLFAIGISSSSRKENGGIEDRTFLYRHLDLLRLPLSYRSICAIAICKFLSKKLINFHQNHSLHILWKFKRLILEEGKQKLRMYNRSNGTNYRSIRRDSKKSVGIFFFLSFLS